jgi:hypothetical protein
MLGDDGGFHHQQKKEAYKARRENSQVLDARDRFDAIDGYTS